MVMTATYKPGNYTLLSIVVKGFHLQNKWGKFSRYGQKNKYKAYQISSHPWEKYLAKSSIYR